MPERSRFDYIQQRKEDGFSQDFWLSYFESGRQEIARREAAAAAPRKRSGGVSRKELEDLTEVIARLFAEERRKLRADIREELLDAKEQLIGMLASAHKVERAIEKLLIEKKVKLIAGGKDAA